MADKIVVHRTACTVAILLVLAVNFEAADGKSVPREFAPATQVTPTIMPVSDPALRTTAYSVFPSYTIRRTVPEVRLQFSVDDENGRQVSNLTQDDVRILDNLSPVQRVRQFSRMHDLPLQVGIVIDVSDSVQKTVVREKLAAQYFVQQVLRPQTDRAFLMAFGREVKLWQASTGDRPQLSLAVQRIQQAGYATNLYDGLFAACNGQFPQSDDLAQRAIVLFSDGDDTDSLHGMQDVLALAQRSEIQIYAVSVHPKRKALGGDEVLRRLTDETGGRFYLATTEKDFPAIFAAMEQQLRTQYYVSFRPQEETPGFHSLGLEMTGPQRLHVHVRQGYYFEAPSASSLSQSK